MIEGGFVLNLNFKVKWVNSVKLPPSFNCNCGCGYPKGKIWVWDSFIVHELTTGKF